MEGKAVGEVKMTKKVINSPIKDDPSDATGQWKIAPANKRAGNIH